MTKTKTKAKQKPIKCWAISDGLDFWVAWETFPYVIAFRGDAPTPQVGERVHSLMESGRTSVWEITQVNERNNEIQVDVKPLGFTTDLEEA